MTVSHRIESGSYWQYSHNVSQSPCTPYRGSPHNADFGLEKKTYKICFRGTVGVRSCTNKKIPHMHVNKPNPHKVGTELVIFT